MQLEEAGKRDEAAAAFEQAWNEASSDSEKYLAAYYIARCQQNGSDKLRWLHTSLQYATKVNDESVRAAFIPLYKGITECYRQLNDSDNAAKYTELAYTFDDKPRDIGPFYHGTKADLKEGDFLKPGFNSNYKDDLTMNHIYFTALMHGAGLAAVLAKGDGRQRVYIVEPTGFFENDPNVTNKRFPGNPTRSYRTDAPLRIVGEMEDWQKTSTEEEEKWRGRLKDNKGEIIN